MIFLFSTSFTIHGSPRRSENSLEILKYLHGTCRYRFSISLFVNFSTIFRWEGKGKNVQKRVEFFPQSTKYPPLSTLRSTPQILRTTRDRTAEHLHRTSTYTRAHAVYVYMHICTESFSENSTEAATTVWIPVYTSLYTNAEFLFEYEAAHVSASRQGVTPARGWLAEGA